MVEEARAKEEDVVMALWVAAFIGHLTILDYSSNIWRFRRTPQFPVPTSLGHALGLRVLLELLELVLLTNWHVEPASAAASVVCPVFIFFCLLHIYGSTEKKSSASLLPVFVDCALPT
jgi:hypothetical protein